MGHTHVRCKAPKKDEEAPHNSTDVGGFSGNDAGTTGDGDWQTEGAAVESGGNDWQTNVPAPVAASGW